MAQDELGRCVMDRTPQEERVLEKRIVITPSYEVGRELRKKYNSSKSDNFKTNKLSKEEKKQLKIHLEDLLDERVSFLMNQVTCGNLIEKLNDNLRRLHYKLDSLFLIHLYQIFQIYL